MTPQVKRRFFHRRELEGAAWEDSDGTRGLGRDTVKDKPYCTVEEMVLAFLTHVGPQNVVSIQEHYGDVNSLPHTVVYYKARP